MTLEQRLKDKRADILRIAARHGARNVRVFGSVARGEADVPPEAVDGRMAYADIPGFCEAASLEEIRKHGHVLTPGRYVGAEAAEKDGELFADKMVRLVADLRAQQSEAARLDAAIAANLRELGYGG